MTGQKMKIAVSKQVNTLLEAAILSVSCQHFILL